LRIGELGLFRQRGATQKCRHDNRRAPSNEHDLWVVDNVFRGERTHAKDR
jgi:hypothetical protein